ncbi:beta-defensin 136 [Lynx canadensis]|uniref:beta-defensin 136 n=1 Tax=Lynx canadensis TaxID=61383 RepID=UPI0011B04647|nr:beta-defensin 136 [Lynx canadensis]
MRHSLIGLLFLLVISLPSGNGLFRHDGIQIRTCTALKGRCFFSCRVGWTWVSFCHNILSCCVKMLKNNPPQVDEY